MKFVAIFLACIVAAQAVTFTTPSYDYWCSHDFQVLPPTSYYCYTVPFKSSWLSTKYYADCLVEFPKTEGDSCEAENPDMTACISSYEGKLMDARNSIESELNEGLEPFTCQIDNLHATYLATFKSYIKNCYDENSDEYSNKVAQYEYDLCVARTNAIENFSSAVAKAMERIQCFHDSIIARFHKCLETRSCKINSYNTKLDEGVMKVIDQYEASLNDITTKRVNFVKCIFNRLYAGTTKAENYEEAINRYECSLTIEVAVLVDEFRLSIDSAVAQLKDNYRCNYKCYFNTGCYGFSRKTYSRSCVRIPSPPKYSYKLVGVNVFKADWNGIEYKCLQTCTADEKNPTFDEQIYIDDIEAKSTKYKEAAMCKVNEWRCQIAQWKVNAETGLSEKIICLMPINHCGTAPTEVEVDTFHQKLRCQAQDWINLNEEELLAQITAIESRINCNIDSWKSKAISYIGKVKEQFECCVANKDSKVASYKTCLENRIADLRAQLEKQMKTLSDQHKCQFDQFYKFSFGDLPEDQLFTDLVVAYKSCVDAKVGNILAKFDAYWAEWQPKLEEHYECGYKCTSKVTTPCMNLNYKWNFCAPSISLCKFHE